MLERFTWRAVLALGTLLPSAAFAQMNGENLLRDSDVKNGSQRASGTCVEFLYYATVRSGGS